jgi:hypothetical protein
MISLNALMNCIHVLFLNYNYVCQLPGAKAIESCIQFKAINSVVLSSPRSQIVVAISASCLSHPLYLEM